MAKFPFLNGTKLFPSRTQLPLYAEAHRRLLEREDNLHDSLVGCQRQQESCTRAYGAKSVQHVEVRIKRGTVNMELDATFAERRILETLMHGPSSLSVKFNEIARISNEVDKKFADHIRTQGNYHRLLHELQSVGRRNSSTANPSSRERSRSRT